MISFAAVCFASQAAREASPRAYSIDVMHFVRAPPAPPEDQGKFEDEMQEMSTRTGVGGMRLLSSRSSDSPAIITGNLWDKTP